MQPLTKPIPSLPGYRATEDGRIYSEYSGLFLKEQSHPKDEYKRMYIKGKNYLVHRLISEAWLPNLDNLPEVNHKDEDKSNNHKDNLEWCTRQYNQSFSKSREWNFVSPSGVHTVVFNIREFCRAYNLSRTCLDRLVSGTQVQHKGWSLWSSH